LSPGRRKKSRDEDPKQKSGNPLHPLALQLLLTKLYESPYAFLK
jgi:hypothetical protein